MRILHTVQFYHPSVGGMQEVVRQLSERLAAHGHSVTVATSRSTDRAENQLNGVAIREFAIAGNAVTGMTGEVEAYADFLLSSDFDIVTNFAAQQWATDIALPLLPRIKAKKIFVPTGFSGLYLSDYKSYFEAMKTYLHHYDMNVFLSDNYRDINFARESGVKRTTVIPNGADEGEFLAPAENDTRKRLGVPEDSFFALHVGSHTGIKGHAEAIAIFRKARIRRATLLIVGNDFGEGCASGCAALSARYNSSLRAKLWKKRILVKELARRDTIAAYQAADLFLFPSNIECSPLVLFEAMASKTPFLATAVGNAEEICRWSSGGRLLPTITETNGYVKADVAGSTRVLEEMYHSREVLQQLADHGFQSWKDGFTWEKIAARYEALYARLLALPGTGSPGFSEVGTDEDR